MNLLYTKDTGFTLGGVPLVDLYIQQRKLAGLYPYQVEKLAGLQHPTLQSLERGTPKQKRNKSVRAILIALLALGVSIEITK